jgi:hypothetical protein
MKRVIRIGFRIVGLPMLLAAYIGGVILSSTIMFFTWLFEDRDGVLVAKSMLTDFNRTGSSFLKSFLS